MGKRSNFERNPRDYYPTPAGPVAPLLPFLELELTRWYTEPMAGDGALSRTLGAEGYLAAAAYDIEPQAPHIVQKDALTLTREDMNGSRLIITNPVWERELMHALIQHFVTLAPTWLLFDSDWSQTVQAGPLGPLCDKIVAVGRVKWFPGTKSQGKDNCSWYRFDQASVDRPTQFFFRGQLPPGLS